jgi:hypothetical protein
VSSTPLLKKGILGVYGRKDTMREMLVIRGKLIFVSQPIYKYKNPTKCNVFFL